MFSRDDTKALKGLAVLMMLFHHLVGFPDRVPPDFKGFQTIWKGFTERNLLATLAGFCHICVCLFFFFGGYGLYLKWKANRCNLWEQIKKLYLAYWKVLVLILPIGLIFFHKADPDLPLLYRRFEIQNLRLLLANLLGNLSGYTSSFNSEWWFFRSYLCMLPMGMLFCLITKKSKHMTVDLLIVCLIDFFRRVVFVNAAQTVLFANAANNVYFLNFLLPDTRATMFYLGIVLAKHDFLVRLKNEYARLRFAPVYGLISLLLIFYMRSFVAGEFLDILYIPLFIAASSVILDGLPRLKKGFIFFGRHSTNFWLVHTFFCYYFYSAAKLVYSTKYPFIDWLILVLMTLGTSLLINLFWYLMRRISPQLRKIFLKPQPKAKSS